MSENLSSDTGREGEDIALLLLEARGLRLLGRNFRRPFGEIDLILLEGDCLVFVEVRVRRRSTFGDGFTSITAPKRRRLWRAASAFLQTRPDLGALPCRFDVVAITTDKDGSHSEWIPDAFESHK